MKRKVPLFYKMFTVLKRTIKYGWKNIVRNADITFVNIFILVLTLSLISTLFVFRKATQVLLSALKEKADVSVYFKENVPEEEILKVKEEISKINEVKVEYNSKEQTLEKFQQKHKENPVLMDALKEIGENPFLASLSIKAKNVNEYEEIIKFLEKQNNGVIEKIDYVQRKPLIEKIFSISSNIERTGIALSVILILVAVLVTFNTIRLSIQNLKQEISIQRLVGASNWFIRGPFIIQGFVSGFFSAVLTLLLLSGIFRILEPKIMTLFEGLQVFKIFSENIWIIVSIQFFCGIFLGIISSLVAISRHLKV